MKTWIPIEIKPPRQDYYWTCTITRGGRDNRGVEKVRYCGGEWRKWDGVKWNDLEGLPTHWYGEAK